MSDNKQASVMEVQRGIIRPHQPGQDVFRSVLPEEIDWKPFAAFPPSVLLAVVVGEPSQAGPYTIRVRVPHGVKLMPHRHPEDRVYTVISGVFYIGLGDQFDPDKLQAYPPGERHRPARQYVPFPLGEIQRVRHASDRDWAAGLEYINAKDDPRNNHS